MLQSVVRPATTRKLCQNLLYGQPLGLISTIIFTCVKFKFGNKIEAVYERSHVCIKVESRSTSRLISTLYILPLFYLRD